MARYIDADLIPYTDDDDYLSQYAYRYDIDEIPTADVAPKSEVENLKVLLEMNEKSYESLRELYHTDTDALVEARRKTEVEVAREIFAEIEKYWIKSDTLPDCARLVDLDKIAELKKKYTGEQT